MAGRWFDPALALALTAICLAELFARPELTGSLRAPVVVILLGAPVAVRRSHPVAAACAVAAVLAANPNFNGSLPGTSALPIMVLAYSSGAHAAPRRALLAVAVVIAGYHVSVGFADFPNVEIAFLTLGPWWIGSELRRRRLLVSALAERAAELEAEQDAFARLSVRRERARIARELHDIVGHHLAVIVVQAGAGRMAAPGRADQAAQRFGAIRQSGGQALAEMARLVDILHADQRDSITGLGKLRVLVGDAGAGGVEVRFTPLPSHVRLPAEIEDSAYHVVQEGLTNAIKHAPGAEVHVRLAIRDDDLEIEVRDSGANGASPLGATGSGLGLMGMRERIEALGGSLDTGPRAGGGWRVHARLPLSARVVTPAR
jgi:signal transduction histidine kinase